MRRPFPPPPAAAAAAATVDSDTGGVARVGSASSALQIASGAAQSERARGRAVSGRTAIIGFTPLELLHTSDR